MKDHKLCPDVSAADGKDLCNARGREGKGPSVSQSGASDRGSRLSKRQTLKFVLLTGDLLAWARYYFINNAQKPQKIFYFLSAAMRRVPKQSEKKTLKPSPIPSGACLHRLPSGQRGCNFELQTSLSTRSESSIHRLGTLPGSRLQICLQRTQRFLMRLAAFKGIVRPTTVA